MAAAKKRASKRRNTRGGGGGLPGWAMLTIGLVIGLFVAFLVYLDDLEPQDSDPVSVEDADTVVSEDEDDDRPRFEFYSILPELEVVVPDFSGDDDEAGIEQDDSIDPGGGELTDPPVEGPDADDDGEASYFLQVGSFQQADKADQMKAQVTLLGLDATIRTIDVDGQEWHRVRAGPFADQEALESAQDRLRSRGIDYLVLRASTD